MASTWGCCPSHTNHESNIKRIVLLKSAQQRQHRVTFIWLSIFLLFPCSRKSLPWLYTDSIEVRGEQVQGRFREFSQRSCQCHQGGLLPSRLFKKALGKNETSSTTIGWQRMWLIVHVGLERLNEYYSPQSSSWGIRSGRACSSNRGARRWTNHRHSQGPNGIAKTSKHNPSGIRLSDLLDFRDTV